MFQLLFIHLKNFLFTYLLFISGFASAQNKSDYFSFSDSILNLFKNEQYDLIHQKLDSNLQLATNTETIKLNWLALKDRYGNIKSSRAAQFLQGINFVSCQSVVESEYNIQLIFTCIFTPTEKRILSYDFIESFKTYLTPAYTNVLKIDEREIKFQFNEYFPLNGLLSYPTNSKKNALVIIMADAGPTEMDGGYDPNRPYKDIAWGLATNGFAVFRYNKRSVNHGLFMLGEKIRQKEFSCRDDYLDDLYLIIDSLKNQIEVDEKNIFILGHGEAGMLCPLIAQERKELKGILLWGANSLNTLEMMSEQYDYLTTVLPHKKAEYEGQKAKAKFAMSNNLKKNTPYTLLPYDVQASYWLWLKKYKHVKVAEKLTLPILILHGGRDYQVSMNNYNLWQKKLGANKNVSFKLYPKLNHIFHWGEAPSTYSEYFMPGNIPVEVITDITNWLYDKTK